jgi:predicted helicase
MWLGELWGGRLRKYESLAQQSAKEAIARRIEPSAPYYLFEEPSSGESEYRSLIPIPEIFRTGSSGIVTARDHLATDFSEDELIHKISRFVQQTDHRTKSTRGWNPDSARQALGDAPDWRKSVRTYGFHPFDYRSIAYDKRLVDWGRWEIMPGLGDSNLGLVTTRMTKDAGSVFCTNQAIGHKFASVYDLSYVYPLWNEKRTAENLSSNFRIFIDGLYDHHFTPEEILGCIYAVLHAPTYRTRYAEFLRIDFPRVPFPESAEDFEALSVLGWELVQAHLLRECPRRGLAKFHGKGDNTVEVVRYAPQEQAIAINKTQSFRPVPEDVWNFQIGGYQVLDKYLKSRKDRKLTLDEIDHVAAVADSLSFTIEQMGKIDKVYRTAFDSGDK